MIQEEKKNSTWRKYVDLKYRPTACFFFFFLLLISKVDDKARASIRGVAAARRTAVGVPPAQVPFAMQIQ